MVLPRKEIAAIKKEAGVADARITKKKNIQERMAKEVLRHKLAMDKLRAQLKNA